MKNGGKHVACAFLMGLMFLIVPFACSQEPTTVPSLGEVARQLKAQQEREKEKPVAVFTNDNLPSRGSLGIASVKLKKNAKEMVQTQKKHGAQGLTHKRHDEKYFRSKADTIRSQLEFHKRQLAVLKQQLGLAKMQYYPDPQKTLEQESTPDFQEDVDKLRAKITNAQTAIANDQKAMNNLQQELRREGGDPGWIR